MLAAPPGWPGLLHQACLGGQKRTIQAVQLCLGQEWQALPECISKAREEGRVGGSPAAVDTVAMFILLSYCVCV